MTRRWPSLLGLARVVHGDPRPTNLAGIAMANSYAEQTGPREPVLTSVEHVVSKILEIEADQIQLLGAPVWPSTL
jgi:hypothetical protein